MRSALRPTLKIEEMHCGWGCVCAGNRGAGAPHTGRLPLPTVEVPSETRRGPV